MKRQSYRSFAKTVRINYFPNTNLRFIKEAAEENSIENDEFRTFLKQQDALLVDSIVHKLNEEIAPLIDCTSCGNCCRSFMINITEEEAVNAADALQKTLPDFKENYIEESAGGRLIINQIPCHFLSGNTCSIYEHRFSGCREFPHLHEMNIQQRLFGLLMYYGTCPIIYNVIEQTKIKTGFKILEKQIEEIF